MTTWVVVVAAGRGHRFGGEKQYERLGERRVIDWSLSAASAVADGIVVVTANGESTEVAAESIASGGPIRFVAGGATRSASVRAGLAAVPADAEVIVVHDAARPLATTALFDRVISAIRDGADAAVPGVAVVDTIRRRDGGVVDRDALLAVQTPQAFRAEVLRAAHAAGADATDDASLVESSGGRVVVVAGEAENRKVTTPADLIIAEALVRARPATTPSEGAR
jgi:2-C-methyl-D-erythritol 4-phosphate cytidylyltransferase